MRTSQLLVALAAATSVAALPRPQDWNQVMKGADFSQVDWNQVMKNADLSKIDFGGGKPGGGPPNGGPPNGPPPQQNNPPAPPKQEPPKQDPPKPEPPKPEPPKPEPPKPNNPPAPAPPSNGGGGGYIDLVNQYMDKRGKRHLSVDPYLEGTCLDTTKASDGKMTHKLNKNVFGQVLAPGDMTKDWKHVFLGGWLCERPDLWNGECKEASKGWGYSSTGHVDILLDDKYKKIGCNQHKGIVCCDLAY